MKFKKSYDFDRSQNLCSFVLKVHVAFCYMVPSDHISVELHIVAAKEPTQRILGCTRFHFLLLLIKSSTYVVSEIPAV